jgi:hypothetical protein
MTSTVLCDTVRRAGERENFAYVCTSFIRLVHSLLSRFVVTRLSRLSVKLVTLESKREVCIVTLPVSRRIWTVRLMIVAITLSLIQCLPLSFMEGRETQEVQEFRD